MKICFVFLLFYSSFLQAEITVKSVINDLIPESSLSPNQANILEAELRLQTLIIESVKQIEIQNGKVVNLEKAGSQLSDIFLESSKLGTSHLKPLLKKQVERDLRKIYSPSRLADQLGNFNSYLQDFITSKKLTLTSTARRLGMQAMLVAFVAGQFDVTLPLVMLAYGSPAYLPLLATPITATAVFGFSALKEAFRYAVMLKKIGIEKGSKFYKSFFQVQKYFRQDAFHTRSLIQVSLSNANYVLTFESQNVFMRFWSHLTNSKAMTFEKISVLLETQLRDSRSIIESIKQSTYPENYKSLLLLLHIEETNNLEAMRILENNFPKDIRQVAAVQNISRTQRQWFLKVSSAKTFNQFINLLNEMPENIPPQVLDKVWRRFVLPKLSFSIEGYTFDIYRSFRLLHTNWEKEIQPLLIRSEEVEITRSLQNKLKAYFYLSLKHVNICEQPYLNGYF